MPEREYLADVVQRAIKDAGSVRELARKTGVSDTMLNNYANGSIPKPETWGSLAKGLGYSRGDFEELVKASKQHAAELRKAAREAGRSAGSVDREALENAAFIFMNNDTGQVWATVEFTFKVRVHNPVEIGGGKSSRFVDIDAELKPPGDSTSSDAHEQQ